MTNIGAYIKDRPSRNYDTILRFLWLVLPLSLLVIAIKNILVFTINHDVAWFLYAAKKVVHGAQLYSDVVDVNPPLIIFITIPPILIAELFELSEITAFKWYVILVSLMVLTFCYYLSVKSINAKYTWYLRCVLLLVIYLVFMYPLRDFGQREHLVIIFVLPYIVSIFLLPEGIRIKKYTALMIGFCAGIGFALKPHFILLWICLELYLLIEYRTYDITLRNVNRGIIIFLILYGISGIYWIERYTNITILAYASYGAYNTAIADLLKSPAVKHWSIGLVLYVILILLRHNRLRVVFHVLFIASTSSLLIAIVQSKGWIYHYYPAVVFTTIFLMLSIPLLVYRIWTMASIPVTIKAPIITSIAVIVFFLSQANLILPIEHTVGDIHVPSFSRYIEKHAKGETIYIFSSSVYPSFPLVNYSSVDWASRFNCLWLVPGGYQNKFNSSGKPDYNTINEMEKPERYMYDTVIDDLKNSLPRLILFDNNRDKQAFRRRFDFKEYFANDLRFAQLLENYDSLGQNWGFKVYKLRNP